MRGRRRLEPRMVVAGHREDGGCRHRWVLSDVARMEPGSGGEYLLRPGHCRVCGETKDHRERVMVFGWKND